MCYKAKGCTLWCSCFDKLSKYEIEIITLWSRKEPAPHGCILAQCTMRKGESGGGGYSSIEGIGKVGKYSV